MELKGDRSVKRVKSYSKWNENLLKMQWNLHLCVKVYSILNKVLLFLQSDPLFYSIYFTVYSLHFRLPAQYDYFTVFSM